MRTDVFDRLLDPVLLLDGERRIAYFNPAFLAFCEVGVHGVRLGAPFSEVVRLDSPEVWCMPGGTWGRERATPYREVGFETPSGRRGNAQVCVQPLGAFGERELWLVVLRDVTLEESLQEKYRSELRRKEETIEQLRSTQAQLVHSAKLALLGQFVAGISHELNNPLTVVLGLAEELERRMESEAFERDEAQLSAAHLHRAAQRMFRLSKQLTSFVRNPQGRQSFSRIEPFEPIEAAVAFLQQICAGARVTVENRVARDLPAILADANKIEQIALNLIKNAKEALVEHRERTGAPERASVVVTSRFDPESATITLVFRDNGPGIPADVLKNLFTPFFTTKPVGQGTGLGLSVSASIAEEHGGTLTCRSEVGSGTEFLLTLPVATAAQRVDVPLEGLRVVIADDEPRIREILTKQLEAMGCVVYAAADGQEALSLAGKHRPDVAVTDLVMPTLSGQEFAVRARELFPGVRLVLLTASENYAGRGVDPALFDARVGKPFTLEAVRLAIQRALGDREEAA